MINEEETQKKVYTCRYCGKEFDNKHKLAGHVTYCEKNPKYTEHLENLKNARKNIKNKFKKEDEPCVCKYCGKLTHNKGACAIHEGACEKNPNRKKHPNRVGNGGKANGHSAWNKGKTALTDERVLKQAESRKNSIKTVKVIIKGIKHTDETKRLLREKMISYVKENGYGEFGQHFSEKGCKYIDFLNEKNGWNLVHAKNGGERQVCGYFLDGYDEELNIAFEYDEPRHYKDVYKNILTEKDEKRQQEIINELGCKFYRYNEKLDKLYLINKSPYNSIE